MVVKENTHNLKYKRYIFIFMKSLKLICPYKNVKLLPLTLARVGIIAC